MDASLIDLILMPIDTHRLHCTITRTSSRRSTQATRAQQNMRPYSSKPHSFASASTATSSSTLARKLIHLHEDDDDTTRDAIAAALIPATHKHGIIREDEASNASWACQSVNAQPRNESHIHKDSIIVLDTRPDNIAKVGDKEDAQIPSPANSFVHPDDTTGDPPQFDAEADLTFSTSPSLGHKSFSPSTSLRFSPVMPEGSAIDDDVKPDVSRLAFEARCRRISNEARRLSKRKLGDTFQTDSEPVRQPLQDRPESTSMASATAMKCTPNNTLVTRKASRAPISKANKIIATAALGTLRPIKKIKQEPADTHYSLHNNAGSPTRDAYGPRIWGSSQNPFTGPSFDQGLIRRSTNFR